MKLLFILLFVLLFYIILLFIFYNQSNNKNTIINTSYQIKNNKLQNAKNTNIKYDEHGTIDTLPKVNKLSNFKDDTDLLIENQFNLHKMNLNRWNYGESDFAPYINGSYKQNTNNYVPGYKFNNNNQDFSSNKNNRINIWKN